MSERAGIVIFNINTNTIKQKASPVAIIKKLRFLCAMNSRLHGKSGKDRRKAQRACGKVYRTRQGLDRPMPAYQFVESEADAALVQAVVEGLPSGVFAKVLAFV